MRQFLMCLTIVTIVATPLFLAAQTPPTKKESDEIDSTKQKTSFDLERNRQQFTAFQQSLLALAQRLEKSSKPEDREKAVVLRQAIELASKEGVDNQFHKLVSTLTTSGNTLRDIDSAINQNEQLTKTLREMIALLLMDSQAARNREEQKRLQELLKMLDKIITAQKIERAKVESGRVDTDNLAKGQNK